MINCLDSLIFPFTASVYYSVIEQDDFGVEQETWMYDRDIRFMAQSVGDNSYRQDLDTGQFIKYDEGLTGRVTEDIRQDSSGLLHPVNEVIITNIVDSAGVCQYMEYAGPRSGQPTAFELKTVAPSFDPFGHRDYFKIIMTRMQNQNAVGVK